MCPQDLSRGSDTFPDTEVAEHPAGQKTQSQLPPHTAQLLNASRHGQHPPSEERGSLRGTHDVTQSAEEGHGRLGFVEPQRDV